MFVTILQYGLSVLNSHKKTSFAGGGFYSMVYFLAYAINQPPGLGSKVKPKIK